MSEVLFYDQVDDDSLKSAAVASRYRGKWVFCRKQAGNPYQIPGGPRQDGENIEQTARRELYEETGAARFRLVPVCVYGVRDGSGGEWFGMLYYAEIQEFFSLPGAEGEKVGFFDGVPGELAFPEVQPELLRKAAEAAET